MRRHRTSVGARRTLPTKRNIPADELSIHVSGTQPWLAERKLLRSNLHNASRTSDR